MDIDKARTRFAADTANHQMAVLHDDGLYRHLRFTNPECSWNYWFDLITVPGSLIFQGDGDSYVFRRIEDMFAFFRDSTVAGGPNISYWAEKLTSSSKSTIVYDEEILRRHIDDAVTAAIAENPDLVDLPKYVSRSVKAELAGDEQYDRRLVEDFNFWINPDDADAFPSKREDFRFDQYGWNCRDYHWWLVWSCHAILWGIRQYDTERAARLTHAD